MADLPWVERLTRKQVAALNRKLKRDGVSPIKIGVCRIVSKGRVTSGVEICRDKSGYYVSSSPHKRARVQKISRSRRMSDYGPRY